jgi:hypothetical protein
MREGRYECSTLLEIAQEVPYSIVPHWQLLGRNVFRDFSILNKIKWRAVDLSA